MVNPYLPDIMQEVVSRINTTFSEREEDPFNVFFDKGIQSQVEKQVYGKNVWPLVWLAFPFVETAGELGLFANVVCDLVIAMPTDNKYTQQDRDEKTIGPFLIPIYDELMKELYNQKKSFMFKGPGRIEHTRIIRPYWGGGDVNGAGDTANLFKKHIDAIQIRGLRLKLKLPECVSSGYAFKTVPN